MRQEMTKKGKKEPKKDKTGRETGKTRFCR